MNSMAQFRYFIYILLYCICSFSSQAQVFYDTEPNNTPAEASRFSGPAKIMGAMQGGDQDGYLWSVSDVDAQHSWSFELAGIADALTQVEIIRLTYTDDGIEVAKRETLFNLAVVMALARFRLMI